MSNEASIVPSQYNATLSIIKHIESGGDMGAMRFERKVFNRITNGGYTPILSKIQSANHCSSDTARVIYSMSFGGYQIMGFNLYGDLGLNISIAKFLNDYCEQDQKVWDFLNWKKIAYTADDLKNDQIKRDHFAVTYNGSTNYSANILSAIKWLCL